MLVEDRLGFLVLERHRNEPFMNPGKRFVLGLDDGGKKVADALHPFCGFVVYRHF